MISTIPPRTASFDAPLAAAQRDGKWVYLDTAGHEVTAPCYDGIYRPNHYTDEPLVFTRAAPLLSGYAVVSRDGKFGLLDSTRRGVCALRI